MLIQYGQVSTSQSFIDWTQPTLTSNGTLGGDSFAVYCATELSPEYTFYAFDYTTISGSTDTRYFYSTSNNTDVIIYNPIPLKLSMVRCQNYCSNASSYIPTKCTIYVSQDNNNYIKLKEFNSFTKTGNSAWNDIDLSNNLNAYKYYKLSFQKASGHTLFNEIRLIGKQATEALNSIIFPISFSNINYSITYAFIGNESVSAYIDNKTINGCTLNNISNAQSANYIAIGY